MKKILFVIMAICFVSGLALAEDAAKPAMDKEAAAPVVAVKDATVTTAVTGSVLIAGESKEEAPVAPSAVTMAGTVTTSTDKEQTPAASTAVVAADQATATTTDTALTAEPVKEPAPAAADVTEKVTEKTDKAM